jgi:hypothetical protein
LISPGVGVGPFQDGWTKTAVEAVLARGDPS